MSALACHNRANMATSAPERRHYAGDNQVIQEIRTPWQWMLSRANRLTKILDSNPEMSNLMVKVLRGIDMWTIHHGLANDPERLKKIEADVMWGEGVEELIIRIRLRER